MTRRTPFALALIIPFAAGVLALAPHASTARARTLTPEALNTATTEAARTLYEVDILMVREDAGRLPRVGSVIERPSHPVFVTRIIVPIDEIIMTGVTHERAYVAGWQPIVGEGVVGYRADVETASEGVEFQVALRPAGRADSVYLTLEGGMRKITMRTLESNIAPPIELPTFSGASLSGELLIGAGRVHVLAAFTAAEIGSWYVAVSAAPLAAQ